MRNTGFRRPTVATEAERLRLFSVIDQHSANGIWIIDNDGRTCWTNRVGREFYDLTEEQTIGVPVAEFERRGVFRPAASLIALRKRAPVTVTHQTACGRITLASANPLINDDGNISLVIVSVTDISNILHSGSKTAVETRTADLAGPVQRRLICTSASMKKVLASAERVAAADCPVLLSGETGVGKTEIAKVIHASSPRRKGPFIAVDCGALPASLIESELFGHAAGAFTGSSKRDKPGLIQMADKGTLFLDEIGELPLDMQVKLLRVIEERRVRPVGEPVERPVDFRIIAASNRNLHQMSEAGRFRSDLYYRLAVVTIDIPPLRERPSDIVPLAEAYLQSLAARQGSRLTLSRETRNSLEAYAWPGNIRELRNLVESLAAMADGPEFDLDVLPEHIRNPHQPASAGVRTPQVANLPRLRDAVRGLERDLVFRAIDIAGSHERAADLLGISLPTLMRKKRQVTADSNRQN